MGTPAQAAVLATLVAALPWLGTAAPFSAGLLTVVAGVGAAAAVAGELPPRVVLAGAAGALLFQALWVVGAPPTLAGAALVGAVHAPRVARSTARETAAVAAALALLGGATASWVAFAFANGDGVTRLSGWAVALALASLPLAVPVDDPVAFALLRAARGVGGGTRRRLLRAVVVRRRMAPHMPALARGTRRRLERAWSSLVHAASERALLWPRPATALDRRIARYVDNLSRAHRAARARDAWADDLDDAVLTELRAEGERLEVEAAALSEVEGS